MRTEVKILKCAAELIEKGNIDIHKCYSVIARYGDSYISACVKYMNSGKDYSKYHYDPSTKTMKSLLAICDKHFGNNDWSWVNDWRMQFPIGVRTFGRLVRGDKKGILIKMKKFFREYPEYADIELVNKVTKKYLSEKSKEGWEATTCADYFIFKDNASMLAAYCELEIQLPNEQQESTIQDDDATI